MNTLLQERIQAAIDLYRACPVEPKWVTIMAPLTPAGHFERYTIPFGNPINAWNAQGLAAILARMELPADSMAFIYKVVKFY